MMEQNKQQGERFVVSDSDGLPTGEDGQDDETQLYYPVDEELALINQAAAELQIEGEQEVGDTLAEGPEPPPSGVFLLGQAEDL